MSLSLWFWTILTGSRLKGLLLEGRRQLKAEQFTTSLRHFREVVESWPDRAEGYEGMERVYRAMGLLEEAQREAVIAEAMKALKSNPGDLDSRLRLIAELAAKQMYATALPHVEQALKLAPHNQEVLRQAAVVLRYNRLVSRALEIINGALLREPLATDLYEQQAFCLRALNRQLEATQALSVSKALLAVAREPASQDALERAIFMLTVVKRRKHARSLVERGLADYPQAPALHGLRGELLLEEERPDEALRSLLEAMALEPTRAKTHSLLAGLYQQNNNQERATWHRELAELLDQARRKPDHVEAESLVTEALLRVGRMESAEDKAQGLCRQYSQDWRSHATLGRVRQEQGRVSEALESYRQATRINPRVPEPYMAMAWLHARAGQVKEAITQARQAVSLVSRDPGLRRQMADLLQELGFAELAKEERALAEAMSKAYASRVED
ncbi:MAG: tetratricopeptide repeat protein [Pseudomonadota bacterium]